MDLLNEIRQTGERVRSGEITVEQAQAEARLYTVQVKTISTMLEHAKYTERLNKGSRQLPTFDIED
jgi:hypothetical protein